ncbi:glycosyl hydrolase family 65 central catalytic domain protein [Mycobacterium ulcerans str. Harvey]|uniref:Glycosyl hydrolase family 65 central catalytic domain protein n=1 Tax=Mycobacterium ulcerans str. Harvey TaxID=1299332 RepID=A0ABP3ALE7_MYCUL|nr:glycosyl hydrolase family 65 central catalytic domain protein [Mycobacterium ulcerans str. Harvey]
MAEPCVYRGTEGRNVDYYERRMVRDSSLSACTQAVMCADVGHLELATTTPTRRP